MTTIASTQMLLFCLYYLVIFPDPKTGADHRPCLYVCLLSRAQAADRAAKERADKAAADSKASAAAKVRVHTVLWGLLWHAAHSTRPCRCAQPHTTSACRSLLPEE